MTKNYEVFEKDPRSFTIPNEGVTKIFDPHTDKEWAVLRYELSSFVCEGEYQKGLERVLSSFLGNLNNPEQPAVWVSGFYGSGKSHFVRVLEYLWRDVELPDGARASSLVKLPSDIKELFRELKTAGKRAGGLWSAAGTLGASAGNSVRLALLAIAFRSADLPEKYPLARFVIWLKQYGYYDVVKSFVEQQGKEFIKELTNLYVSPLIAQGLMQAYPNFAKDLAEARSLLKAQYPQVDDVSNDELLKSLEYVLELQAMTPGKLPLTLLVFDELQQFLGEDQKRTDQVQEAVQVCCARFGSQLLFVSTGQAALEATPQLSKLLGRFKVRVTLEDNDVERVVRDVILRKQPDKVGELKSVLETTSGEIDRHLAGTRLATSPQDKDTIIPDYPLLPTRRRFWESVLRAIDPSGTGGQLRTQLSVVHESVREIAERPLGTVVPADAIYDKQKSNMLQSAVLLREMATIIEGQNDGTVEGRLRSRLCATIFLIGKLPITGVSATGLRSTPDILADLLVDDLMSGSASLRQQIPEMLKALVETGTIMQVGDEYRLQTRESSEWEADYRKRYAKIRSDDIRVASDRASEFRTATAAALKGISLTQGASKTPRKFDQYFGPDMPKVDSSNVPVWVRDEWTVTEKAVREDAQSAGVESPVVFVVLPRRDSDALKDALASYHAADETIEGRSAPNTPEGSEARQSMESRKALARQSLDSLVANVVNSSRILQGGGNEVVEGSFKDSVKSAVESSLVRLFPKFSIGDHSGWGNVVKRAQDGAADALSAIGYIGDVDKQPACQDVRTYIGPAGKKGSEVRKQFMGAWYGWPQDAVDGALLVLLAGGFLKAKQSGQVKTAKNIIQSQIGITDFYSEGITVTVIQRIAVRKLITDMGLIVKPNEEAEAIPLMLQRLLDLAEGAGGLPPQPSKPDTKHLDKLFTMEGNEQFVTVYEARDGLLQDFKAWSSSKDKKNARVIRWELLQRLLKHAISLPDYTSVASQITAIQADRTLLMDPDPLTPLLDKLVSALRIALQTARKRLSDIYDLEMGKLLNSPEWNQIGQSDRQIILSSCGVSSIPIINVGNEEEILATLDATSLKTWEDKITALPARFELARIEAIKLLEPKVVHVKFKPATLKTNSEVQAYLDELRTEIMQHIDKGNPVML